MSKVVTIPDCANPFIVYVNGYKYSYEAGATVEVPDEVAFVIETHKEYHEANDGNTENDNQSEDLPVVDVADVGKFLRVNSEGKWDAEAILIAEEVVF